MCSLLQSISTLYHHDITSFLRNVRRSFMKERVQETKTIELLKNEILRIRLTDLEEEKRLCFSLSENAINENDTYALMFSYTFLGDYYLAVNDNQQGYHFLHEAKRIGEQFHYNDLLVRVYNYTGMFYSSIYDEITALDYYLKSLQAAEIENDILAIAAVYNNIANCFEVKKSFHEALKYYQKSYEYVCKGQKDSYYAQAMALSNLCHCSYHAQEPFDFATCLSSFDKIPKEKYNKGMEAMRTYCEVFLKLNTQDMDGFYQKIEAILKIEKEMDDVLLAYQIILVICKIMLELDNEYYAQKCLKILKTISMDKELRMTKEVQEIIIEFCRRFNYQEALSGKCVKYYDIIMDIEKIDQKNSSAGLQVKMEAFYAKEKQSNLEQENDQLKSLVSIDDLTGILNRRSFEQDMHDPRLLAADSVAVAMLDVDYFKEYNDFYGHQKGDSALVEIGKSLQSICKVGIRAYRYGGDEFAILFDNVTESTVYETLQTLKEGIENKKIEHDGYRRGGFLSITCGFAFTKDKVKHMNSLLKAADDDLYKQKEQRKYKKHSS